MTVRKEKQIRAERRRSNAVTGGRRGAVRMDRAIWGVALATVLLVPLIVTPSAYDSFRLPKEMLVRAAGILIVALAAIRWLIFGRSARWQPDRRWIFAAIVIGWTAVTALTARQKTLAAESLLWVAAFAVLFVALDTGIVTGWWDLIYAVLFAALVNALYCLAAVAGWTAGYGIENGRATGFLGNSDDMGSYFGFAIVAALALSIATPRRRLLHVGVAVLLILALMSTQTIGSFAALFASLAALALVVAGRRALTTVGILLLVGGLIVAVYQPFQGRVKRWLSASTSGKIDDILSNRGAGILAAWEMAKDRPLVGVGPGCYGYEFYRYKIRVEGRHESLAFASTRPFNFGQAHCDHLETMAQTGVPGYILLLAALGFVSLRSFTVPARGVAARFARLAGLPLAVSFAVSALPQFPMELAGPMITALAVAVPCTARVDDVEGN